ncbi:DAK2 domain-containing protein [Streptomyces sp. TS71-3]|uniref:DAK2 domain-containing protein n=1 Tax=Streptomyces sp. TS71-3 TaxID=2733862 RepID=UPI001BB35711|nr:DAK2 domain-containing protein [Streptomyces sp. TS71-3]
MPPSRGEERVLDADSVRTWCTLALEGLGRSREEIDAINVYPVADGDTGTNLYLTLESAARAVEASFAGLDPGRPTLAVAVRAMAHGALIGACGNSGTIVAQLLRGMAQVLSGEHGDDPGDGGTGGAGHLRRALRRAAESAYTAVTRPVEGTVLTVASAAAEAAERAEGGCVAVARAAHEGARVALEATPGQLKVLDRAGVVDAGGQGLVVVLAALADACTGRDPAPGTQPRGLPPVRQTGGAGPAESTRHAREGDGTRYAREGAVRIPSEKTPEPADPLPADPAPPEPVPLAPVAADPAAANPPETRSPEAAQPPTVNPATVCEARGAAAGTTASAPGATGPAYEVMYLLEAGDAAVDRLRNRLDGLGDSLVVVGGDGLWNVHVHVDDAGAAVEAGVEAGRPHRIRIAHFGAGAGAARAEHVHPLPARRERAKRAVVAVVPGEGLGELCASAGAFTVLARPGEPPASGELVAAIRRADADEVVLLPNDDALGHTAAAAAGQVRTAGIRVAVIPTRAAVQGIAALAVHAPDRRFDEDVVAMTSAARSTRFAELTVAERQSWTTAGVCQAGDVLGMIDGDVAVIGPDPEETAAAVLDRMLSSGGEMVTLVLSDGFPEAVAERLEAHVRESHLAVDSVVYQGGHPAPLLFIGVE